VVTIPSFVSSIGDYAFRYNKHATSVMIPSSVISIGAYAFFWCQGLTNATLPNGLLTIGQSAFGGCWLMRSITIPDSVTNTGDYVFEYCSGLTEATLSKNVSRITYWEFYNCASLTSFTIPPNVTSISNEAFAGCLALTNLALPSGLLSICEGAFSGCTNLTTMVIPSSVTNIGIVPFAQDTSLSSIQVDANNPAFTSIDGVLFSKDKTTLLAYPNGKAGSYSIPNGVTSIAIGSLEYSPGLVSLTIPASVTIIWDYAIAECHNLTSAYFKGDAPDAGLVFLDDPKATAYYIPGTANWTTTFGGIPTAKWIKPSLSFLIDPASFGMHGNAIGLTISGMTNTSVVVETATNLCNPQWRAMRTNQLTSSTWQLSDTNLTHDQFHFYRARTQ
jgi:hypothetical protein